MAPVIVTGPAETILMPAGVRTIDDPPTTSVMEAEEVNVIAAVAVIEWEAVDVSEVAPVTVVENAPVIPSV